MLLFRKAQGSKTHLIDELATGDGPPRTLCTRLVTDGETWESSNLPTCTPCLRTLRRLQKQLDAAEPPLRSASRARMVPADLRCPLCDRRMALAAKKHSFPTRRVNIMRVTLQLICDNEMGHAEAHDQP